MKIGVVGDIHGNYPALNAVLTDLESRNVEQIYCTGDLIGVLGWNNKVVSEALDFEYTVLGNHDARVSPNYEYSVTEKYSSEESLDLATGELYMAKDQLTENNYEWIASLPEEIYNPKTDVYMTHSSPSSTGPGMKDGDAGIFPRNVTRTDVSSVNGYWIFVGHSHKAFEQKMDKFPGKSGHIVNPGTIGYPIDGSATYAVADLSESTASIYESEYDTSKVKEKIRNTGVDNIIKHI